MIKLLKISLIALMFPSIAISQVRVVPVLVSDHGADLEAMEGYYRAALTLLPVKIEPETPIITSYAESFPTPIPFVNPPKRWASVFCPTAEKGVIYLVLEDRGGGSIGMTNGNCTITSKCSIAHAQISVDPNDPITSIVEIAHEIGHSLGAFHVPGCSLMSTKAIQGCGRRALKVSADSKRDIKRCMKKFRES